jgi:arylformamidase
MPRFMELSHVIRDGLVGYPGFPPAHVRPWMTHEASRERYDGQAEFTITEFGMVGNTGTYLDSPYHRDAGGADISGLGLGLLAGLDGVVLDPVVGEDRAVRFPALPDVEGKAVLVRTGWSARYGHHEYWEPGPYLGAAALDELLAARPALVGVDFANVDDTGDPARPAHTRLLRAGILIVEHLTDLEGLPGAGFRFFAIPLAIEGAASSPVRAFAELGA